MRTGLYFLVAGSTLGHLVDSVFWNIAGIPLMIIGVTIMGFGIVRYFKLKKAITASKKNIGCSSEAFIKAVIGGSE
jgi:hypothetical protein